MRRTQNIGGQLYFRAYGWCMGIVIPFPRRSNWERELSKRQVAVMFGYSTRWVELRVRDGMPSRLKGNQRRFLLSEVEPWLDQRTTS